MVFYGRHIYEMMIIKTAKVIEIIIEPAVNAQHDDAGEVEADAAADDGVGGGEVECTGGVLCVPLREHQGLWGAVQTEGDGHEGDEAGQQPDTSYRSHGHTPRHPPTVPVQKYKTGSEPANSVTAYGKPHKST